MSKKNKIYWIIAVTLFVAAVVFFYKFTKYDFVGYSNPIDNSPVADSVGVSAYYSTSVATTTVSSIKSSAGTLYGAEINNSNTSDVWFQFFDAATSSVQIGTTTPRFSLSVPKGDGSGNSGKTLVSFSNPIPFSTAITVFSATASSGSTPPTTSTVVTLFYK